MAGAGWKTWVAGEEVTATNMQTYIQDQVQAVFASTAARDSAIASPSEGMVCAVTGTDRIYTYSGSAWVITGWYGTAGRVGCNVRRAATQTINAGAQNAVTWDTEDADLDAFIAVSSTTVTIPTGLGGLYVCDARVQSTATLTSGACYMTAGGEIWASNWISGGSYGQVTTGIIPLVATATVDLQIFNGSASNRDFTGRLTVFRVGI